MVYVARNESTAWMEHGLQISLKRYELSMEDKMAAEAFGCGIMREDCDPRHLQKWAKSNAPGPTLKD